MLAKALTVLFLVTFQLPILADELGRGRSTKTAEASVSQNEKCGTALLETYWPAGATPTERPPLHNQINTNDSIAKIAERFQKHLDYVLKGDEYFERPTGRKFTEGEKSKWIREAQADVKKPICVCRVIERFRQELDAAAEKIKSFLSSRKIKDGIYPNVCDPIAKL